MIMKTLYFEGAGCVPRGEVSNCRIRTAFTNDKGKQIYLEIIGIEVTKHSPDCAKNYRYAGFVDTCLYITDSDDENNIHPKNHRFEYTNQNILDFVNKELHCSFDNIVILPDLAGYQVFADCGDYNFGDEFVYDAELTQDRQKGMKNKDEK
jgi:hypothetical protein